MRASRSAWVAAQERLGETDGFRRLGGDRFRGDERGGFRLPFRHHAVDEARRLALVGTEFSANIMISAAI